MDDLAKLKAQLEEMDMTVPVPPLIPSVVATAVPLPPPLAHTEMVVVHSIPEQPTAKQHASRWFTVLSALEGLLAIGTSAEVTKLLPPKYAGYVAAASVVDQVASAVAPPKPSGD